jgi:hypothetical protein
MQGGVNLEDEWEDKGLIVREFGLTLVAEEYSIGEEALAKDKRVTRTESTTFAWGSKIRLSPELSHTQPFSLYFD